MGLCLSKPPYLAALQIAYTYWLERQMENDTEKNSDKWIWEDPLFINRTEATLTLWLEYTGSRNLIKNEKSPVIYVCYL